MADNQGTSNTPEREVKRAAEPELGTGSFPSYREGTKVGGSGGATSAEELEGKSKEELVELAAQRGLTVTREDGGDGEPLKSDYVAALSK